MNVTGFYALKLLSTSFSIHQFGILVRMHGSGQNELTANINISNFFASEIEKKKREERKR